MKKKTLGITVAVLALCAALVIAQQIHWKRTPLPSNALQVDLSLPDALIRTQSLARLPRDILKIPLARDVLAEDFVFYYEQNEDRLGLKGTLRRIAYEHELNWGDQLIQWVLDEPADMALWRDHQGKLQHYIITTTRGNLTRIVETAAKVALQDSQLTLAGEMRVDGDKVKIFALEYAHKRKLLLIPHGDRLAILSDPGLLFKPSGASDGKAENIVAQLISSDTAKQRIYQQVLHLEQNTGTHTLAVRANFLSFGYQQFFPGLIALRFDYQNGAWSTQALLDGAKTSPASLDARTLWSALPYNPSLCAAVPIDWKSLPPILERLGQTTPQAAQLAEQFNGPAAVCWYGDSHLHTPVFVATLKSPASSDLAPVLSALFQAAVGASEVELKPAKDPRHPVHLTQTKGEWIWKRAVSTPQANPDRLNVTLASHGNYLIFSPDEKAVTQALAVLKKRYPAVADTLPAKEQTLAWITPSTLAALMRRETLDNLPASEEEIFRNAANAHLLPRLDALKRHPPYRMVLEGSPKANSVAWQAVTWHAVQKRK